MKKGVLIFLLILFLCANMILTFSLNLTRKPEEAKPADKPEDAVTEAATEAPQINILDVIFPTYPHETQAPTQPKATEAPAPKPEPGRVYTSEELNALDNSHITYGPGLASNGDPAPYAPDAQTRYGKYDAHFLEDTEGVIYLTFDCGYEYFLGDQPVTGLILDTLKEKDVKAVFFVTGSYVEHNPDLVRRIINEGHVLGNHSSGHRSMPGLSIADMEDQILPLHKTVQMEFGVTMKFFRPPEGAFSLRSLAVTQNLGYETVHWSFAYADWDPANQPDPQEALDKILSCHHDGAIYLLHALSATNAEILGDVIDGLRDLGYRLEPLN